VSAAMWAFLLPAAPELLALALLSLWLGEACSGSIGAFCTPGLDSSDELLEEVSDLLMLNSSTSKDVCGQEGKFYIIKNEIFFDK
jgi:hypothetical protein